MTATPRDAAFFEKFGYIGPFRVMSSKQTREISGRLRAQANLVPGGIYPNNKANHDRHLDLSLASWLVSHPAIVNRVRAAIGQNVLCWRSSWFPKMPGDAGTEWHQATRFYEFEGKPHLTPTENEDGVYEVTAWLAIYPTTKQNACMRIVPGSHKTWHYDESRSVKYKENQEIIVDGERLGFYGYSYSDLRLDPDFIPDKRSELALELDAGECVIFTSRLLHGSYPNTSDNVRLGFAARYCAEQVKVYPGADSFTMFGEAMPLDKYSALLVSGETRHKHNRVSLPLPLKPDEQKIAAVEFT